MNIEYANNINVFGLTFILLAGIATLLLPRRFALLPLIVTACYLTMSQFLIVVGLQFSILRIIIFFYFIRLVIRSDVKLLHFNILDKVILLWVISNVLIYYLYDFILADLINRLGFAYNVLGLYFVMRAFINDIDDCYLILKSLAIILIPLALMMAVERVTMINSFSILGGVPQYTHIRGGKIRAYGPFGNSILAGIMAASSMPLLVSLWFTHTISKTLIISGVAAAFFIIIASNSSGPILVLATGVIGLLMWQVRDYMSMVKYTILFLLVTAHFVMEAPVWYLIAKAAKLMGGAGWYRAELIDQAIRHFDEWWIAGTRYTIHWMPTGLDINPDMADIANFYIRQAVDGGLLTLVMFVIVIVTGFKCIGTALIMKQYQALSLNMFVWSLGAALLSHTIAYLNVSYFDQTMVFWYLLLAMIAKIEELNQTRKKVTQAS